MLKTKITPLALVLAGLSAPASANLIISEYVEGSGYNKAIELYNTSSSDISLGDYTLQRYSNGSSTVSTELTLSGTLAANSTYVIVNADSRADAGLISKADLSDSVVNFNGDDALVLMQGTTVVDSFGQRGVDPGSSWSEGGVETANKTLRRKDGIVTGRVTPDASFNPSEEWTQFDQNEFTGLGSHAGNGGGTDPEPDPIEPIVCAADKTLISAIQGEGNESPLVDTLVELEGIVTADFQGDDELKGFFVTSLAADEDTNPLTSEGVFVYFADTDVNVGDHVRVQGTVDEYFDSTQISDVVQVAVCATGQSVSATKISLPLASQDDLEAFEGMLVTLDQELIVTNNFGLGRYGEVELATERLYQGTQIAMPGDAANAVEVENLTKKILVDDGSTTQNSDPTAYPTPGLSAENTLRTGDSVNSVTGALAYSFSTYRIHPTVAPQFIATNPREDAPELHPDADLRVASFNVLNYFNGDGQGAGFPTSRGADSLEELVRQEAKLVSAISAMQADVVGLMEIENDGFGEFSAIASLVNALNDADSANEYAFVDFNVNQVGTDAITTALIYRANKVEEVGTAAITTTAPFDFSNRTPIAQSFKSLESQEVFTVAVAHLKSKGGCGSASGANEDQNDGQACWNEIRTEGASAFADWLDSKPTGVDDEDIILVGDMNAYAMEDPIRKFDEKGYKNVVAELDGNTLAYSYSFSGRAGSLDHAVATESLLSKVVAAKDWHINADEPIVLDYNVEFKSEGHQSTLYSESAYRASDHDPVIVDIKSEIVLTPEEQTPVVAPDQVFSIDENSAVGTVIGMLDYADPNPEDSPVVKFIISENDSVSINDQGQLIVAGEIDYEFENRITFTVQVEDSVGNVSKAEKAAVKVNNLRSDDDNDAGSLLWLSLLLAPLSIVRRFKKK
ncbi:MULTISPECIES: ExeM/NucH family extracellular endonuclease [unclassified Pseudoalteromonas]|uniref:ExeM/NucH family extracellular endonuclease n=1 Tax=unclassified Pseudoalteromonas TaxID=194690 RepID=UPI0011094204|nr:MULTISPECIES: ExeM/NucH family extracellular endonuclease [unclassified Pseudoalteromonas]TMN77595.1 DNA degradation protein EddB [Pseudoalteromonas sp. S410]TMN90919.1 DNA degradation protein EddB [Pseudoalteromonas sp. S408]TMN94898.1 DNA degradation protein EddB [Pseudoalteromonas sp. S407]TMN95482.1 DNA degradation protein EddB [Pseudoalteromonas sp. S409]TMO10542.1 DNA degradation protein EddB [Pseudoalteromonas sp. S186]